MKDKPGNNGTATGTVRRLTTAPKGEVDGAVLDDGTVLHWPPHTQDHFTAVVRKGVRVRAVGEVREKKHGPVLEIETVTDLATNEARSREDALGHRRPGGPHGPDRRLRTLEAQVELLTAEVRRLGGKV